MIQRSEQPRPGLDALAGAAREANRKGMPPVHLWNPPYCGDLDMRVASDGTWFYLKTPIGRPALVQLFASVTTTVWLPAETLLKTPLGCAVPPSNTKL